MTWFLDYFSGGDFVTIDIDLIRLYFFYLCVIVNVLKPMWTWMMTETVFW